MKFKQFVSDPLIIEAMDAGRVEVRDASRDGGVDSDVKGKDRRLSDSVPAAETTLARVMNGDSNRRNHESIYQKPTQFKIIVKPDQEPIPVSGEDLKGPLKEIPGLGILRWEDVWNKANYFASQSPGAMIHSKTVPTGPYQGWQQRHLDRRVKMFYEISGSTFTFTVGLGEDLNRLR